MHKISCSFCDSPFRELPFVNLSCWKILHKDLSHGEKQATLMGVTKCFPSFGTFANEIKHSAGGVQPRTSHVDAGVSLERKCFAMEHFVGNIEPQNLCGALWHHRGASSLSVNCGIRYVHDTWPEPSIFITRAFARFGHFRARTVFSK